MLHDNASRPRIVTVLPNRTVYPVRSPEPASFLLRLFHNGRLRLRCGCLDRCLGNICWSGGRLLRQSLLPEVQSPRAKAFEFGVNLVPLGGQLVGMLRFGPKVRDGKAVIEVGAEVVHDANREHDIHAKLVENHLVHAQERVG